MKKYLLTLAAVLCTAMSMTVLTSCSVEDNPVNPQPQPENVADVTIILYGMGGASLDNALIDNLRQFYRADASSYDNVKIAVQYKFSAKEDLPNFSSEEKREQFLDYVKTQGEEVIENTINSNYYIAWMDPEGHSTFRFVLDPSQTLRQQAADNYLPQENCDFSTPDSLTNFINWAAQQCPAKKYVLLLADHGISYFPPYEKEKAPSTRAIFEDHGHDKKQLSIKELASAIAASNISPAVIYFDACLMNTIEYQFELKDLTDYIVASTYGVPGPGGLYSSLVECLSGASDNLEYALEKYIEYANENWDEFFAPYYDQGIPIYNDITVTRTANITRLGEVMREFTDRLCDTYENGTDEQRQRIDEVTRHAVKTSANYPSYDVAKYMTNMMNALPEVYDDDFYNKLADSFNNCLVAQFTSQFLLDHNYQVDYNVLLGAKGHFTFALWSDFDPLVQTSSSTLENLAFYNADGTMIYYKVINGEFSSEGESNYTMEYLTATSWGGTLESVYSQTAFDRAVGWCRWLLLNQQEPPVWARNEAYGHLPDGDLADDPTLCKGHQTNMMSISYK
ncbi:MAG: hypothetical protein J5545_06340 [Bacteroidaceae bacterium]|nr:hypothetical protein [Bacteroidaceae bacterium]